jgi:hypothetical protein
MLGERLSDIGVSDARYVVVRNGERAALITPQSGKEASQ